MSIPITCSDHDKRFAVKNSGISCQSGLVIQVEQFEKDNLASKKSVQGCRIFGRCIRTSLAGYDLVVLVNCSELGA